MIEREAIALNIQEVTCDLHQFRQHLRPTQPTHAALSACVALYKGDFLQGFSLRDSVEFDNWQTHQREYWQHSYQSVLEKLLKLALDAGNYTEAIQYAQSCLALDPLYEPAHRQLIQLYAWAGQRTTALKQYQQCVRILDDELGVPPLEETTELYTLVLENRLQSPALTAPLATPPTTNATLVHNPLPLIGRDDLIKQMQTCYETCQSTNIIAIEGEAGIGKTRLVQAWLERVGQNPSISMICYENETTIAYAPLIRCLREALQQPTWLQAMPDHWLADLAQLLPELPLLRPIVMASSEVIGAQIRLFEALSVAFSHILHSNNHMLSLPSLLLIENVQWIDHASLDFLSYWLKQNHDRQLHIMTWRSEDIPRTHRLRLLLHDFERHNGMVLGLSLTRLTAPEIAELAQKLALPGDIATFLYRESEGLPFFLAEYLRFYRHADDAHNETPQGIRDLLHSRLAGLGAMAQQLLGTAAVIGRSFDHELLHEASGRSEDEVLEGVEELLRRAMIHEISGATYEFYHEKLRELVYQDMSMARRRLLHKRLANTLLGMVRQSHQFPQVSAQIAYHFHHSGQESEAARYYFEAGLYARRVFANHEALRQFQTALALRHPNIVDIYQHMGDLQTLMGDYPMAIRSYETALAHAESPRQAYCEQRLANIYQRLGEWDLSEVYYQSAYDKLAPSGTAELGVLLIDWCMKAVHQKRFDQAQERIQLALTITQHHNDAHIQAQVYNVMGILARKTQHIPNALAYLEQSLQLTMRLKAVGMQVAVRNNLALTLLGAGQPVQALRHLTDALELCQQQGDLHHAAALHNNLADVYHALKQPHLALEQLKKAVGLFAQIGMKEERLNAEIWNLAEW
jgi:predicted ATPase